MAKCTRCGRKGLFLKLTDGLCGNCVATVKMEQEQALLQRNLDKLNSELSDKEILFKKIEEEAVTKGTARSKALAAELDTRNLQVQERILFGEKTLAEIAEKEEKGRRNIASAENKVRRSKELVKAIQHAVDLFDGEDFLDDIVDCIDEIDEFLSPTVLLPLQSLDMKELRKRYKENEKNIQSVYERYKSRYTTKANITIYRLMVIALSAELQNVLHTLSFGKLDDALSNITAITSKYYAIASDGNQTIAPTVQDFIGEIDYYFKEAVRIEYEYYVQKERAREEQRAIREQMRQEAEERKELERQRKQIEKEESKYHDQIKQLSQQMEQSDDDEKTRLLKERIEELQRQLGAVAEQREKIVNLQNGKAGNVYVISNIGSFGEDVFKIGMTRRLEPMDRVNELGSASVPFPFDVHSMIFSDDAVSLETQLHHILNDQRVNKVNLRKEFFRVSLDDLEKLVGEIAPTAEFKRTVLAEQYRQSLSIQHVSENPVVESSDEEEDE